MPTAEIIDVSGNPGISPCARGLYDLPYENDRGVTLRTVEGNALLCGGRVSSRDCIGYDPVSQSYVLFGTLLNVDRYRSASVELPNGTFWILGGTDENAESAYTTEYFVGADVEFIMGPEIPPTGGCDTPCASQVNDTVTFYGNDVGYLFDSQKPGFRETDDPMPRSANAAACGSATLEDGSRVLVVAGGNDEVQSTVLSSVMMFDTTTNRWADGPALPFPLTYGTVVPTERSFLILGGRNYNTGDYFDTILEFDPLNMEWIVRDETLSAEGNSVYAITVDRERFCP